MHLANKGEARTILYVPPATVFSQIPMAPAPGVSGLSRLGSDTFSLDVFFLRDADDEVLYQTLLDRLMSASGKGTLEKSVMATYPTTTLSEQEYGAAVSQTSSLCWAIGSLMTRTRKLPTYKASCEQGNIHRKTVAAVLRYQFLSKLTVISLKRSLYYVEWAGELMSWRNEKRHERVCAAHATVGTTHKEESSLYTIVINTYQPSRLPTVAQQIKVFQNCRHMQRIFVVYHGTGNTTHLEAIRTMLKQKSLRASVLPQKVIYMLEFIS
jgi:hypothetical protein